MKAMELVIKTLLQLSKIKGRYSEDEYIPYTVSVSKWCNAFGIPERFNWIRNLIIQEAEEDEELNHYIFLSPDIYDIRLDNYGVFIFSHILGDFFGIDHVRSMWRYLNSLNEENKAIYDLKQCLKNASDEEIKECEKLAITFQSEHKESDMVQEIVDVVHREQKKRSRQRIFKIGVKRKE